MAREKLCLGIDIGASSVKICQLKRSKKGLVLQTFGVVELPSETVVDGALMNSARVVEAIQELILTHKIKNKNVALAISGHSVIIKKIPLPHMTREELEESIQWEAEQFIPFDIDDVNIDVQIVNEQSAQAGQMDVVLVAAKKDVVNEYTSVVIEAGLEPMVCDVDAFAVETMFEENYTLPEGETIALVNAGASKTNINIISNGISSFTRDLAIGGNSITEEIQKQASVTQEEAEMLKTGQKQPDAVSESSVRQAIRIVAQSITSEVQRSIDFYGATTAEPSPSRIYLTGGSAQVETLLDTLKERIQVPVEVADPFRKVEVRPELAEVVEAHGASAAVAIGLALRFPGDT